MCRVKKKQTTTITKTNKHTNEDQDGRPWEAKTVLWQLSKDCGVAVVSNKELI